MASLCPHFGHVKQLMFSTMPSSGTCTLRNIWAPRLQQHKQQGTGSAQLGTKHKANAQCCQGRTALESSVLAFEGAMIMLAM
jgi:hypothetical protein